MASPQLQTFFIYDSSTGSPVEGATIGPSGLHFEFYKNELGADLSQPTITEIGGGAYSFTPVFVTDHTISYTIICGSGVVPSRVSGFLRPEDYLLDTMDVSSLSTKLDELLDLGEGKWEISKTGPYANMLTIYTRAGAVLGRCALTDATGTPTSVNPYSRGKLT